MATGEGGAMVITLKMAWEQIGPVGHNSVKGVRWVMTTPGALVFIQQA